MSGKTTTSGVLLTDGKYLLICKPNNSKWWDIPKGRVDQGESEVDAAVRELEEETSYIVEKDCLEKLGVFDYKSNKQLALFRLTVNDMPDTVSLFCRSMYEHKGKMVPEMVGYAVVEYQEALKKLAPALSKLLEDKL
jgi:8-oxo-dGTP pyrophosphatase MutT (NUDIX family)